MSPQFHIVFDDHFSTTQCLHTDKIPTNWSQLLQTSSVCYVDEDFNKTNFYPIDLPSNNQRE
ncbi:MAG: hypothetical protein ACK53Y_21895, partial [bacterium]